MTTPTAILQAVATYYGLKRQDLTGPRRDHHATMPRFVAMYLIRRMLRMSFPRIGEIFEGRDHTTVMSGVRRVEACLEEDGRDESVVVAVEDIWQMVLPSAPDVERMRRVLEASRKTLLQRLAEVEASLAMLPPADVGEVVLADPVPTERSAA